MPSPHCQSSRIHEQPNQTSLGYRTFRCAARSDRSNERMGTPFNDLSVPTDIVLLAVLSRLRFPLSLRHPAEMSLERSFAFSHETVHARETSIATPMGAATASSTPPTRTIAYTYDGLQGLIGAMV